MKKLLPILLVIGLVIGCESPSVETTSPDVEVINGVLSFKSEEVMGTYLSKLGQMSLTELKQWNADHGFKSYRELYETVVETEWKISDHYEMLQNMGKEIPKAAVFSDEYIDAVRKGLLITDEVLGFDYPFFEVKMSPVLNLERMVAVDGKIYQYNGLNKKIIENGNWNAISVLNDITETDNERNIRVIHYLSQLPNSGAFRVNDNPYGNVTDSNVWAYYSKKGNEWHTRESGKFRAKAHMSGSSYADYGADYLYVTNVFRVRSQKRNIWGEYKPYSANLSADVTWDWYYFYDNGFGEYPGFEIRDLPVPTDVVPPTSFSPMNFYGYGNDFVLNMAPHINGYYYNMPGYYDCGYGAFCGGYSAVFVSDINASISINGFSFGLTWTY